MIVKNREKRWAYNPPAWSLKTVRTNDDFGGILQRSRDGALPGSQSITFYKYMYR